MAENQNDKKMPQGNQNQNQKPGMKPDVDQKKPQSGQQGNAPGKVEDQGFEKKGNQNIKPDSNTESGVKPQSNRGQLDDDELGDEDEDRITQRNPARGVEPQRK